MLLWCIYPANVQGASERQRLNHLLGAAKGLSDSSYIRLAFEIADAYMSMDHYDSAQLWLNAVHGKLSYRQPSVFSYFLTTRQAEVYYYNNLQQLGMQEAERAIAIATALKDSILLADACNFHGLFYTNMGRLDEAVAAFKKGIAICRQPPYPPTYLELTNPHHLYGNLSEAFDKMRLPDSAVLYGRIALQKAQEIEQERGITSAALSLGSSFLALQRADSAVHYFELARITSIHSKDFDLELNAYSGLALCASLYGKQSAALSFLERGFTLLNNTPQLNSFYALLFLEQAARLYKDYKKYDLLAGTLERKSAIQVVTYQKSNQQYLNILMTGLKNETRILNLEVAEARQDKLLDTTRLYLAALVFLLLGTGFIAYRYYTLQKLKLADLRNKISQDLHDEVGATLSGIALYSYIAKQQNMQRQDGQVIQSLDIIDKNATDMVKKLSDIVWAVNPIHDSLEALLLRLEEYAVELGAAKNIVVSIDKQEQLKQIKLSMEQRKNIYLIIKEAINNAVKYSGCSSIAVTASLKSKELFLIISDDGSGFDPGNSTRGNGLLNMLQRAAEIHACMEIKTAPGAGTTITLQSKITQ